MYFRLLGTARIRLVPHSILTFNPNRDNVFPKLESNKCLWGSLSVWVKASEVVV